MRCLLFLICLTSTWSTCHRLFLHWLIHCAFFAILCMSLWTIPFLLIHCYTGWVHVFINNPLCICNLHLSHSFVSILSQFAVLFLFYFDFSFITFILIKPPCWNLYPFPTYYNGITSYVYHHSYHASSIPSPFHGFLTLFPPLPS